MRHDPASGAIIIMLRSLKMHGMAQAVTDLMEQGAPAFDAAVPMLAQLLKAEVAEREVRSIAYHMKAARFPAYKDLSGFDFAASEINEATVRQLHRCEFMDGAQNVVLIGGPGTGKTHVATALACRLSNITAARFASSLVRARQHARTREGKRQSWASCRKPRPPGSRDPGRTWLPAVQCIRRRAALPSAQQTLRAHQRRHHHEPELQRMGHRLRRS
jgi:hypothetical protein